MATDNFQTLSPGLCDVNGAESLFHEGWFPRLSRRHVMCACVNNLWAMLLHNLVHSHSSLQ